MNEEPADRLTVFGDIYHERHFDPALNPRMKGRRRGGVITLYHFTRRANLPSVGDVGINRGDVPVRETSDGMPSPECFNNAVWLTERGSFTSQRWVARTNKNEVRLTVEIDEGDANLWRWRDLARHLGITEEWYQRLNASGGGFADKWWVYVNESIPPSRIVSVQRISRSDAVQGRGVGIRLR